MPPVLVGGAKGFALYVLAEAGMAEVDARHRVIVVEDATRTSVHDAAAGF